MAIIEPEVAGVSEGLGQRTLTYPIRIAARILGDHPGVAAPPPPPPPADSDRRRQRRWLRRSMTSSPAPATMGGEGLAAGALCASVHARLGGPAVQSHIGTNGATSSSAQGIDVPAPRAAPCGSSEVSATAGAIPNASGPSAVAAATTSVPAAHRTRHRLAWMTFLGPQAEIQSPRPSQFLRRVQPRRS